MVWMPSDKDDRLLDVMHERAVLTTPKLLAFHIDEMHYEAIRRHLRTLHDRGFVEHPEDVPEDVSAQGVYQLSDLGRRYVSGELTVGELRDLANE